jgi:hypothetical protein
MMPVQKAQAKNPQVEDSASFHFIEQPTEGSKAFSNFSPFKIFLILSSITATLGCISGSNASFILP